MELNIILTIKLNNMQTTSLKTNDTSLSINRGARPRVKISNSVLVFSTSDINVDAINRFNRTNRDNALLKSNKCMLMYKTV
jgi:hypothetical protein